MTGKFHGFVEKAVLMTTGEFGRICNKSTNALINTSDGQAFTLRAGVPIKNMEFIQFHSTTLYGTDVLIVEATVMKVISCQSRDKNVLWSVISINR